MAKSRKTTSTNTKRSRASNRSAEPAKVFVGLYPLSGRGVKLYLITDLAGGCFDSATKEGVAEIEVGLRSHGGWGGLIGVLLHEATELTMLHLGLRFSPYPDYANDSADYVFLMTHAQFGSVMARVGEFISDCVEDLSEAYKKAIKHG